MDTPIICAARSLGWTISFKLHAYKLKIALNTNGLLKATFKDFYGVREHT